MSHWALRILASVALASAPFADVADAGVGGSAGGALSSFGRLSPAHKAQYRSNCWYGDGWNGRGWYRCGDQWNDRFGWIGPLNAPNFVPLIRRHHRHGAAVGRLRVPNTIDRGVQPSPGLGAGRAPQLPGLHGGVPERSHLRRGVGSPPSLGAGAAPPLAGVHGGVPAFHTFGAGLGSRHFGAGGLAVSPGFHTGGAPVSPGVPGVGFHRPAGIGVPHIGAHPSPGFTGGGFHGSGGAGGFHGRRRWSLPASARQRHPALPAEGFMALEGSEASAAAERSHPADMAARIADRPVAKTLKAGSSARRCSSGSRATRGEARKKRRTGRTR